MTAPSKEADSVLTIISRGFRRSEKKTTAQKGAF